MALARKNCVLLPAAGWRTQFFHLIFTEPGKHTFAGLCRWTKISAVRRGNIPEVYVFNFKLAKFCRHAGTVRSPLSEYRLTLPSVVMALPPTVIRSLSGKQKFEIRVHVSEQCQLLCISLSYKFIWWAKILVGRDYCRFQIASLKCFKTNKTP